MILKKIIPLSILAGILSSPQLVTAHTDGAYAHQSRAVTSSPDWMKFIDGNKRVSELSIPGTHDTMSRKSGVIWQNQTMTMFSAITAKFMQYIDSKIGAIIAISNHLHSGLITLYSRRNMN